jgi:hypothetical protein
MRTDTEKWVTRVRKGYTSAFPEVVFAFPSPHVEKWYLLHPSFWTDRANEKPQSLPLNRCQMDFYKARLRALCRGFPLRGVEYGEECGAYIAERETPRGANDFDHFMGDLRNAMKRMSQEAE